MVRIRLKRIGRKKDPFYRLVIAHRTFARSGKIIEEVGVYDPALDPVRFDVVEDRIKYWLSVGALPSDTVQRLLAQKGLVPKKTKVPKTPGVTKKQKAEAAKK